MILLALFTITISFYTLYNTSRRAELPTDVLSIWLQRHTTMATAVGLILLILSFYLFVSALGLGVGICAAFIALMTMASLVVVLAPFKKKY